MSHVWRMESHISPVKRSCAVHRTTMRRSLSERDHMALQRFAPACSSFLTRTKSFMVGNKDFAKIEEAMRLASTSE
jgi:hypothetical protein